MKKTLLISLMLVANMAIAQRIIIGTITDENSSPLEGVKVAISNTKDITVTNFEGKYKIEVPYGKAHLEFSKEGYHVYVVEVTDDVINLVLKPLGYEDLFSLSLEEMMNIKVVTASKKAQKTSEAPATMMVITARQIQERGYEYLDEALRDLPGFDILHVHGVFPTFWTQRGLYGDENKRTLVLVDGFVENNLMEGNVLGGPQYTLHNVERIEVLYGPASALYGANALNGIINIITKKGEDINGVQYYKGYGSYNTKYDKFLIGGKENNIGYSLSASLHNTDGPVFKEWHPNFSESFVDNAYSLVGRLSYKNTTFGFSRFDRPMGGGLLSNSPVDYYGLPTYGYQNGEGGSAYGVLPATLYNGEHGCLWHSVTNRAFVKSEININKSLDLTSQVYYRKTDVVDDTYISYATGNGEFLKKPYTHTSNIVGGELRLYYQFGESNLTTGISYDRSNVEKGYRKLIDTNPQLLRVAGLDARDYNIHQNFAAYSQLTYDIPVLHKTHAVLGVRYDNNNLYGNSINPRIALVSSVTEHFTIKALMSTAYRAPNNYELFSMAVSRIPNPDLRPEKGTFYELSLNLLPIENLSIEGCFYYNDYTDIIISNVDVGDTDGDGNSNFQNRNLGRATVMGLELKANLMINQDVSLFANYTWLDGEQTRDGENFEEVPNVAGSKGNAGINIRYIKPFVIDLTTNWSGKRSTLPSNPVDEIDGFMVFNLTVSAVNLFKNKVDISLSARNIFDQEYFDPGIRGADAKFYSTRLPQPGRSVFLKVGFKL